MNTDLSIMRLIPTQREELFDFFVRPDLLEMWDYPEGMSLKVPVLVPRAGGDFRFEYTGENKSIVLLGNIKEFMPGTKLADVCDVLDQNGNKIFGNLETYYTFSEKPGGTLVTITERGFPDEKSKVEWEKVWNQCLDRLGSLFRNREVFGTL